MLIFALMDLFIGPIALRFLSFYPALSAYCHPQTSQAHFLAWHTRPPYVLKSALLALLCS